MAPLVTSDAHIREATVAPRWLLEQGVEGIALTKTNALSQAVVREAARRWPHWWNAELFGEPHREAELVVLETLHATLLHLRLVRRRSGRLLTTPHGRELLADPTALFDTLLEDLQGHVPFHQMIWSTMLAALADADAVSYSELDDAVATRARGEGWRDRDGVAPTEREISGIVADLVRRAEACGVVSPRAEPGSPNRYSLLWKLTDPGRRLLTPNP